MNQQTQISFTDLKLDWDNAYDGTGAVAQHMTVSDALIMSLANKGKVDIGYISLLSGKTPTEAVMALKGSIFRRPEAPDCWVTSEQYLSGNLIRKLREAETAEKKYPGRFSSNIEAIKAVLPRAVPAKDIYVTLGSPWVPTAIIEAFIDHILGTRTRWSHVSHDVITGSWDISGKNNYNHIAANNKTYGTARINALHILEKTLNMKSVVITDEVPCRTNKSGVRKVVNKLETIAATEKQEKLIAEFKSWVWKGPKRKKLLENIFAEKYGCVKRRLFDGSFLEFPTMDKSVKLYPYQKNAVARILFSPNTLLAHDVGAGKTFVMIAAAMELKRLHLSDKNMFVVPNNLVGQWKSIFLRLYPSARVLCVEPKSFVPERRRSVLEDMRDGDYDGIIIAYSCFDMIPLSKEHYITQLKEQIKEAESQLDSDSTTTSLLRRRIRRMEEELSRLVIENCEDSTNNTKTSGDDTPGRSGKSGRTGKKGKTGRTGGSGKPGKPAKTGKRVCQDIYFDSLHVTRLFVDEAHNYKNVPISTQSVNTPGISVNGSDKCALMLEKVRHVQRNNNGGGVIFATGTPITNSITDAYIIQLYLQEGELKLLDLASFDAWTGMFAEKVTGFEIDVDTSGYRMVSRFARFHNLPELTGLIASVADFHKAGASSDLPQTDGYDDRLLTKSAELEDYLTEISARADAVRSRRVRSSEDNMLLITTDGRKAALDVRLVRQDVCPAVRQKVDACAENVARIYYATKAGKSTQLVFCDFSTPKQDFNLYDELKDILVQYGIPADEIRYVHEATTEAKREKLYGEMREGRIRVLIGSTVKLGQGVNIQDRLIALHHMDVPWRPSDMTQREGRILRQGNMNPKVQIFRYITEGSFDAYSWQLLETKQRFIADLLSGSISARSGSDIEDTVLGYAEVKALAVGNPLIKERVETANELTRLITVQRRNIETRDILRAELDEIPEQIRTQQAKVEECRRDCIFVTEGVTSEDISEAEKKVQTELRKKTRKKLAKALSGRIYADTDYKAMTHRGFDIVVDASAPMEKPRVFVIRAGKYRVELGDTEIGNLKRIDNFIDGLKDHLAELEKGLTKLREKQSSMEKALAGKEDYSDMIRRTEKKLEELDKKIGLEKVS